LISPPPHHDIYSIEDLAQLIYDLKNANDSARISVKLCSEHGVGTIACGVAKAGAQVILISGFDGGTGAAHQSSIHSCGMPFELGILEAHQALSESGLRTRVALETDGKLMSGRDVAIAALLGAQEFGFATAPLVTMGCRMMRVCSQDTCPFGIATQNEELRKRFKGKPEYVMRFMLFIAEQVREIMAQLGIRTLEEMVGRTDLLKIRQEDSNQAKSMEALLKKSVPLQEQEKETFDFHLEKTLDYQKLIPGFEKALKQRKHKEMELKISSTDRSFGTAFGSRITRALKPGEELEDDLFVIKTKGGAGQSFGAFIPKGMTIENTGDANDYFGKGLSGGKLILKTPEESPFAANENVIAGNVAFYGATAGEAYINGKAGERFCVRNSGANVVVEGVGDHGLEYMTGGTVLVLGDTGKNFAAGMSGGCAYVLDSSHTLYKNLNESLVRLESVSEKSDIDTIRTMLKNHLAHTGSKKAQDLLERFDDVIADFKKIVPVDYAKMQSLIKHWQDHGYTREQAERKAFNQFHPKLERGAESTTH
jgi:glutamate synthase (ferredoxin)